MELILLIFFCCILIFWIYNFSKCDIMSPSILLCSGYCISLISCWMNRKEWNVDIHVNTVLIIMLGIATFVITEILFLGTINKKNYQNVRYNKRERKLINVPNSVIILCTIFNIIVAIVYLKDIVRITGGSLTQFSNYSDMMHDYRQAYSYGDAQISTIATQLMKFAKGIGYTFLYIFFNNMFISNKEKYKIQIKYLIPTLTFLLCTLLLAGRINMISLIVASIFLIYYNWNAKYEWKKKINVKILKNVLMVFVVFLVVFYSSKVLVGRKTEKNFIDYITTYLGGSIELLDEYVSEQKNYTESVKTIETFPGIIQSFYKIGFSNINTRKSLEFRHIIDGEYLGNIYTGLRRYYHDFGCMGIVLIQILYSLFFNILYYKIKYYKKNNYKSIFMTIYYSYTLYCILIQSMEDHFFINLSLGYILELIIVYFMIRLIISPRNLKNENNEIERRELYNAKK